MAICDEKLLAEYRRDAEARLQYSIQYHYDDSGRSHKTVKLSPDDRILEEARCGFTGWNPTSWIRVAMTAYRFTLDKHGNARKVALSGGMKGSVQVYAEFGYDSRRRHATTRFFGADSSPIGRDTIIRGKSGDMRELRRFNAAGLQVASVVHGYGPRGELNHKAFPDAGGKVMMKREQTLLAVDSLARLNASASEWMGPAATGPCDLTWYRNVDLGIELGACRAKPGAACIKKAYADLNKLVKEKSDRWNASEAIDTSVGLVLEVDGDRAYAKLLARAKIEGPSLSRKSDVIQKLLKYRLDKAYSRFCRTPGFYLDNKSGAGGPACIVETNFGP